MKLQGPIALLNVAEAVEERSHDFQPKSFDDYLGQEELKHKLAIYTQAALMRAEPLDHLLLFGPPGLGKTTLAQIMAHIMQVSIKICSGPMLERTGDLVALLTGLAPRDILFIDEIHRIPIAVEEVLYSAMEQYKVDVIIGQGAGAQSITLPVSPFTLIGATTRPALLSAPLRSRFGITERLDFYKDEELQLIVKQNSHFLGYSIDDDAALTVACCARGTPRIAKKILRRVRDFAQVHKNNHIDSTVVANALTLLGIDDQGLTVLDHAILKAIIDMFCGGPVGLETIASVVGEDSSTIEEVYEPFLLRKGYLEKTSRGRQIPPKALPYLKNSYSGQKRIFEDE
jgi:Holliday junction DNA helicase RuvB